MRRVPLDTPPYVNVGWYNMAVIYATFWIDVEVVVKFAVGQSIAMKEMLENHQQCQHSSHGRIAFIRYRSNLFGSSSCNCKWWHPVLSRHSRMTAFTRDLHQTTKTIQMSLTFSRSSNNCTITHIMCSWSTRRNHLGVSVSLFTLSVWHSPPNTKIWCQTARLCSSSPPAAITTSYKY